MIHEKIQKYHFGILGKGAPNNDIISKQSTSSDWPTRSMSAQCMGSAYISGSSFLAQRKLVSRRASTRDTVTCMAPAISDGRHGIFRPKELTAQQKRMTENKAKRMGTRSQPRACNTAKKPISRGTATNSRVNITNRGLGPSRGPPCWDEGKSACAWRPVESRETKIAPTLPGRAGEVNQCEVV